MMCDRVGSWSVACVQYIPLLCTSSEVPLREMLWNALRDSNGLVCWDTLRVVKNLSIFCSKIQIVDHRHHLDLTILSFPVILGMDGMYTSRGNLTDLLQSPTLFLRMTGGSEPMSRKWGSVDTVRNKILISRTSNPSRSCYAVTTLTRLGRRELRWFCE